MKLASTICIAFVAAFAGTARAQFIVLDGDNLQAAINAAPSGSIVEIQSNGTFSGSVSWGNKDLVLRAGTGFTPRIKGVVTVAANTTSATCSLEGLRIAALNAVANSASNTTLALHVSKCDVDGLVILSAGKGSTNQVDFFRSTARGSFAASGTEISGLRIRAVESGFSRNFVVQTFHSAGADVELRRTRINRTLSAFSSSARALELDVESSLIAGPGTFMSSPGVDIGPNVFARFVNATITGYGVGLRGDAQTTGENLLVYGNNGADLGPGITSGQIANSLIQDGTFAGINGNFGGTPVVGPDYRLLPGSIGIDAGNDAALALGVRDFYGDARIQDGDGDGVAHVDVGAVEL